MNKIATLVLVLAACARAAQLSSDKNEGGRQKRLLFFDEGGSLVKTYSNPYLNSLASNPGKLPFYGNILNPFFSFIQTFGNSLASFTVPVSNAIVQQIQQDPAFQNSLVVVPKNPVVEPNSQCEGKRTQIPSPSFCNNFLNCWDGWAVEQECPTGLLFSTSGYCDYADNVNCHNRKVDADKLQPQPHPTCNKDFETFRSKLHCSEFYVCVNRQPVRFKCPADLSYSQILGVCDYPDRVDCKSTAAPAFPPFQPSFPSVPNLPVPSPVGPILIPQKPQDPASQQPNTPPSSSFPPIPNSPSFPSPALPTIPPKFPSPGSSLSPGSSDIPSSPMIPPATSDLRPSFIKPLPPASVLPAPAESIPIPAEKPGSGIFTPGCASNVAMSRQDAIRQLQALTY